MLGGLASEEDILLDSAQGNFDIFNYSWGSISCRFDYQSINFIKQVKSGVENLRNGKGAIYIKAAGNDAKFPRNFCNPESPPQNFYFGDANISLLHTSPWMIVVGSINANGVKASYSIPGSSLWVTAPAGEISQQGQGLLGPGLITTDASGCKIGFHRSDSMGIIPFGDKATAKRLDPSCNYFSEFSGTSSAAPITTGVVALVLEANPDLTWRDVKHILAKTSRKVDSKRNKILHPGGMNLASHVYQQTWVTNAAGYNFHNWYGFGMINALAAVRAAQDYSTDLGDLVESDWWWTVSNTLNLVIPDNSASGVVHTLRVAAELEIEAIQIKMNLTHDFVGEIGIELLSPSGTKSILLPINSLISAYTIEDRNRFLSNAFYGEDSQGNWIIKIIDPKATRKGVLRNWSIKIFGH